MSWSRARRGDCDPFGKDGQGAGYLTCTGPSGCADQTLHLPASFQGGASKEVFQLQTEDNLSGAYAGAIVVG